MGRPSTNTPPLSINFLNLSKINNFPSRKEYYETLKTAFIAISFVEIQMSFWNFQ
jgi:hypothetical protein